MCTVHDEPTKTHFYSYVRLGGGESRMAAHLRRHQNENIMNAAADVNEPKRGPRIRQV